MKVITQTDLINQKVDNSGIINLVIKKDWWKYKQIKLFFNLGGYLIFNYDISTLDLEYDNKVLYLSIDLKNPMLFPDEEIHNIFIQSYDNIFTISHDQFRKENNIEITLEFYDEIELDEIYMYKIPKFKPLNYGNATEKLYNIEKYLKNIKKEG